MSTTHNMQSVDSGKISLHAEKSAALIQEKIRQKRIAEASRLFQKSAGVMSQHDRDKISTQLTRLVKQVESYLKEANSLEAERKLEQAREKYKHIEGIAIDYPEVPEALSRIDEAITLVWALKHRAERRKSDHEHPASLQEKSSQSGRFHVWLPRVGYFVLFLVMVGTGGLYLINLPLADFEEDTPFQVVSNKSNEPLGIQQAITKPGIIEIGQPPKHALDKEKAAHQPWPSEQYDWTLQQEQAALFTKTQYNRQENLNPEPVSPLNREDKITDTRDAEEAPGTQRPAATPHTPQLLTAGTVPLTEEEPDKTHVATPSGRENTATSVYIVAPGDTLGSISSNMYGTSSKWPAIANANKDKLADNPDGLQAGMSLIIPIFSETGNVAWSQTPPDSLSHLPEDGIYTVQPGDSLSIIAQKFFGNVRKWKEIYELNNDVLTAPHILRVGQVLRIIASGPPAQEKTVQYSGPKTKPKSVPKPPAAQPFGFWSDEDPSEDVDSR